MDIEKYDFESALEQGFKTLFDGAGMALRIADDIGQGELPDERLTLEMDTGGPISDEHQNAAGEYDNYGGTFAVEINSPRVPNDQTAAPTITQPPAINFASTDGVDDKAINADTDLISGIRYLTGMIRSATTGTHYATISGAALTIEVTTANVWQAFVSTSVNFGIVQIVDVSVGWDGDTNYSEADWSEVKLRSADPFGPLEPETDPVDAHYKLDEQSSGSLDGVTVVDSSGNGYDGVYDGCTGGSYEPPISKKMKFRNRHRQLVATARKTLEEIDAATLLANWPGALSPTKITPSGTDRENGKDSQMTTLTYAFQFRIA